MISTYSELKAAIATWIHRTDLAAVIPDFIRLAESRISRELPLRVNDIDLPMTATPGSRFLPLPADYLGPYALYLTTVEPRKKLTYKDVLELDVASQGWPEYWTINGADIELDLAADIAHTFLFRYRTGFMLSDANPINWLLTNHPDIYLYGSLLESAPYIKDDERLGLWQNRFDLALVQVLNKEMQSKSIATLTTDLPGVIFESSTNIYTDS